MLWQLIFRYSTMISIKLAKLIMSMSKPSTGSGVNIDVPASIGVVLSLLTDSASWVPHRDLIDTMGLLNNILCHGKVSFCRSCLLGQSSH